MTPYVGNVNYDVMPIETLCACVCGRENLADCVHV